MSVHLQTEEHLFTKIFNLKYQQRLSNSNSVLTGSQLLNMTFIELSLQMLLLQMTSGLPQLPSLNGLVISA